MLLLRRGSILRHSLLLAARELCQPLVWWGAQEPLSRRLPCLLLRGRWLQRAPYLAAIVFLCIHHLLLRSLGDLALLAVKRVAVKGCVLLSLLGMIRYLVDMAVTPAAVRRNATLIRLKGLYLFSHAPSHRSAPGSAVGRCVGDPRTVLHAATRRRGRSCLIAASPTIRPSMQKLMCSLVGSRRVTLPPRPRLGRGGARGEAKTRRRTPTRDRTTAPN